ncbi:hypothetical protein Y09_1349 [Brachybacterium sp. SW0106-09]|uniref:hypothetical protein n=1 Tax=Brachybacterium sp. SW0106-09 TaxID=1704590 RepID=UPI0006B53A15|nr:hypothetical protein [Brachybacterium sp. SW0106-09]GAP78520.1 hypothetical protein Y09_1349 [Brachybacterium sp. SW0106-09]
MNAETALEKLRDAVQDWVRADTEDPDRIVTAFVISTETVTIHDHDSNYVDMAGIGSWAVRVGLAHILTNDLAEGDDE